jgi:hypothetical protein
MLEADCFEPEANDQLRSSTSPPTRTQAAFAPSIYCSREGCRCAHPNGTLSFMIHFNVATGQVICPSYGPTRTEADFVAHVRRTVANDPTATQWHFVADNLDIHRSESLGGNQVEIWLSILVRKLPPGNTGA